MRFVKIEAFDSATGTKVGLRMFKVMSDYDLSKSQSVCKPHYTVAEFLDEIHYENAGCELQIHITQV